MKTRAARGKSVVSKRRLAELARRRREADELTAVFLAADDGEPKLLDDSDREALRITIGGVIEAERVFARLRMLKSERARRDESETLAIYLLANIQSLFSVKMLEILLTDCKVDRAAPLPRTLSALMTEHSRVFRQMTTPNCNDNGRARLLLRLIQLEMIWFGQMW